MIETQIGVVLLLAPVLAIAVIDARYLVIPNALSLFMLASGIVFVTITDASSLKDACIGVLVGGMTSYAISEIFVRVRGYKGLGLGDVKLVAAGGAWVGWLGLAPTLFLAATTALVYVAIRCIAVGGFDQKTRIPFAPFLGGAIFVIWLLQKFGFSPWIA